MDMEPSASQSTADEAYKDVFKTLDGVWLGDFLIFEDKEGQKKKGKPKHPISMKAMEKRKLKEVNRIKVEHRYKSESPFYQLSTILDTYFKNGEFITHQIQAVNKVQEGKLWCIVDKPNDYVVHEGELDSDGHIIWHRYVESPLKWEYFREKAEGDTYEIVGYGYYGEDDINLEPKTWFYGAYKKK